MTFPLWIKLIIFSLVASAAIIFLRDMLFDLFDFEIFGGVLGLLFYLVFYYRHLLKESGKNV